MKITEIKLDKSNSYLIFDDENRNALLVDTGLIDDRKVLMTKLFELLNIDNNQIKLQAVILTHGHARSSSNAKIICDTYKCPCYLSKDDLDILEGSTNRNIYTDDFKTKFKLNKIKNAYTSTFIDRPNYLFDMVSGDTFSKFGFNDVKVVNLSGHTRGSIGILVGKKDLLCGDTLINETKKIIRNPIYEEKAALHNALENIKDILPQKIYPLIGDTFNYDDYFKMEKIVVNKNNNKNKKKKK